jgi:hypothetical protein
VHRGAQGDQEVLLLINQGLVAGLLGQRERPDGESLLGQRIGDRREGVAAAEAAQAELLVQDEGRALARERLAVQRESRARTASSSSSARSDRGRAAGL